MSRIWGRKPLLVCRRFDVQAFGLVQASSLQGFDAATLMLSTEDTELLGTLISLMRGFG